MLHKSLQKRASKATSKATQKPHSHKQQATRSLSTKKSLHRIPSKLSTSSTSTSLFNSSITTSLPKSPFTISSRLNSTTTTSFPQAPPPPPSPPKSDSQSNSNSQRRFVPRSADSSANNQQKFEKKKPSHSGTHLQFTVPAPPQTDRKKFQQWLVERENFCWQHDPNCRATAAPARLNIINKKNYLHMISLVRDGKNDELDRWLYIHVSTIQLNAQDFFGSTPLCTVAKKHLYGTLKTLIKHGADVNYASSSGTPLMHAAATLDLPIMQALLEHGANPNLGLKSTGQTPLMIASAQINVAYPLLLIEHEADINAQDVSGRTALMFAVRKGSLQMMTMLLDRGAKIEIADDYGFTALHYAKSLPHEDEKRGPKCMLLDKFNEKDGEKKVIL